MAGDAFRQEFLPGDAEDLGEVLRPAATPVPFGAFDDVLVTRDWTPLEPEVIEDKYYAPGVGKIVESKVAGEVGRRARRVHARRMSGSAWVQLATRMIIT